MAYEIGYRRPPASGRFKKGRSGQPQGTTEGFTYTRKIGTAGQRASGRGLKSSEPRTRRVVVIGPPVARS